MSICPTAVSRHGGPLAYRINDAAAASGLCRSHLYNLMRAGQLEFVQVGKVRMIRACDLRKLLQIEESADK
jgi:hypothetical protein